MKNHNELVISLEQAENFASYIIDDIAEYISNNQEEYEKYLRKQKVKK